MNPWIVLPAIVIVAALYVLVPVAVAMSSRFRAGTIVLCPGSNANAAVLLTRTGLAEAIASPSLRGVSMCSNWPERAGCDRRCLSRVDAAAPAPETA